MKKDEILKMIGECKDIRNNSLFEIQKISYKDEKDIETYGDSFSAILHSKDFIFVKVNGVEFKTKRITEDFGSILFIYNFNQVKVKIEEIYKLELNITE